MNETITPKKINLSQTLPCHLATTTEDPLWLIRLVGDMVTQVLGSLVPTAFHQIGASDKETLNVFDNLLKDTKTSKETGRIIAPKYVVPHPVNDPYAPYKPLPFIDGLRKAGDVNLDDPDIQDDDKDLSGLTYKKRSGSLFINGVDADDVYQGQVGDCYFLAALSSLAETNPDFIKKNIQQNVDGTYTIGFHNITLPNKKIMYDSEGAYYQGIRETTRISVDADLPQYGSQNLYAHGESNSELWVALYEKAYAEYKGGDYDDIQGGDPARAFYELVGLTAKTYKNTSYTETQIYNNLKNAVDHKYPMVAAVAPSSDGSSTNEYNIKYNHAYSILDVKEEGGTKFVQLRNPYGYKEWTGEGSDSIDDGKFWMPVSDFRDFFYNVTVMDTQGYDHLFNPYSHPKKRL